MVESLSIRVSGRGGHPEHFEAHAEFREILYLRKSERFPYEFDGLKDDTAYELDWGGGSEIYKDFFKALYYRMIVGRPLRKLVYCVRDQYPDKVFNGFRYARREAKRMQPILSTQGIEIEVVPVRRLIARKTSRQEGGEE
jgi:hypothetical protein